MGEKQRKENPAAEQIIIVKTTKDNIYFCVNYNIMQGNYEDEKQFFQMLVDVNDVEVKYIVCMWKNGGVDIPSANFRKNLFAICPKNEEAIWVGLGEKGLIYKTLKDIHPL